jgi:hypothetical protein
VGSLGRPSISTGSDVFTYDAPSISDGPNPSNAPKKSGLIFTSLISGADFSIYDLSSSVRLGSSASESTRWLADSAVLAASPSFATSPTNSFSPIVSVGCRLGSETFTFSYDASIVSVPSSFGNGPTTGSSTFGVFGDSFSSSSSSPRVRIDQGSAAEATRWRSSTSLLSRLCAGVTRTGLVIITLASEPVTISELFSFNSPNLRREISTKVPFGGAGGLFKWTVSDSDVILKKIGFFDKFYSFKVKTLKRNAP